jgi:hypothetical protein
MYTHPYELCAMVKFAHISTMELNIFVNIYMICFI